MIFFNLDGGVREKDERGMYYGVLFILLAVFVFSVQSVSAQCVGCVKAGVCDETCVGGGCLQVHSNCSGKPTSFQFCSDDGRYAQNCLNCDGVVFKDCSQTGKVCAVNSSGNADCHIFSEVYSVDIKSAILCGRINSFEGSTVIRRDLEFTSAPSDKTTYLSIPEWFRYGSNVSYAKSEVSGEGIDQANGDDNQGSRIYGKYWSAQSFRLSASVTLQKIALRLVRDSPTSENLVVEVRSGSSSSPDPGFLAQRLLSPSRVPTSNDGSHYVLVDFSSSGVSLVSGEVYWIVLYQSGSSPSRKYYWFGYDLDTYPGGSAFRSKTSGSTWEGDSAVTDFGFKVYFEASEYVSNPSVDVGGDNSTEWSHSGAFSVAENFSGSGFVRSLDSYIDSHAGSGSLDVPLVVHSDSNGRFSLSRLYVNFTDWSCMLFDYQCSDYCTSLTKDHLIYRPISLESKGCLVSSNTIGSTCCHCLVCDTCYVQNISCPITVKMGCNFNVNYSIYGIDSLMPWEIQTLQERYTLGNISNPVDCIYNQNLTACVWHRNTMRGYCPYNPLQESVITLNVTVGCYRSKFNDQIICKEYPDWKDSCPVDCVPYLVNGTLIYLVESTSNVSWCELHANLTGEFRGGIRKCPYLSDGVCKDYNLSHLGLVFYTNFSLANFPEGKFLWNVKCQNGESVFNVFRNNLTFRVEAPPC